LLRVASIVILRTKVDSGRVASPSLTLVAARPLSLHVILGEGGKGGGEEGEDQVQREADSYTVIKRTSETSALPDKDQFCR
jgi:hypothetical protein